MPDRVSRCVTATPVTDPATTIAARRHIRSGWVSPSHTWLISAMIGKEMASAMPPDEHHGVSAAALHPGVQDGEDV